MREKECVDVSERSRKRGALRGRYTDKTDG